MEEQDLSVRSNTMKKKKSGERVLSERTKKLLTICSFICMLAVIIISITMGNFSIPLESVFGAIATRLGVSLVDDSKYLTIVCDVRLPRIFLAALGGIALSISGSVFQGVFRNILVEPYVMGVSSAAAFGAALSIAVLKRFIPVDICAFASSVIAIILAYSIATKQRQTPLVSLILAGLIVSSVFTALLNLIKAFSSDGALIEITFWLMGGFYTAKWKDIAFMLPTVTAGFAILCGLGWKINLLSIGEEQAKTLGVNVNILKILLIGVGTFLTAGTISRVGIISWVGLMIPHAARMIIGPDHRYQLPFAGFLGGTFMVLCDTIARTIIFGELPVSIITSLLGAPYLIMLLRKNRQVNVA